METIELLRDTLLKLRQSSMNIRSEKDLRNVMESYDMLFLGENFNRIYARELHHYMKKKLGLSLPHEEFLDLIPGVCDGLNMPYETLVFLNNPSKRADYQITLF